MQLTKRGEYAMRTLIQLGIAQKMGREVTPVSTIANKEKLPLKFLENIISELRHGGYIASKRGKMGGVMLAKMGHEITIGEVVRLVDGRLAPIGCASETDYEKCSCPDEIHCGLRMLMIDVRNSIANILDRYTLADIVFVTIQKMERDGVCIPFSDQGLITKSKLKVEKSVKHVAPEDGFLNWLMAKI
jgi:Rrf2 family protein